MGKIAGKEKKERRKKSKLNISLWLTLKSDERIYPELNEAPDSGAVESRVLYANKRVFN